MHREGYFDGKSLRHGLQESELDPGYCEGEARPVEVCSGGRGGRHACPCEAEVQGDAAPALFSSLYAPLMSHLSYPHVTC